MMCKREKKLQNVQSERWRDSETQTARKKGKVMCKREKKLQNAQSEGWGDSETQTARKKETF